MNIDKLSEIKEAATKALAGRKKLNREGLIISNLLQLSAIDELMPDLNEVMANAKLIAAAPELLETCKEAETALKDIISAADSNEPYSRDELVGVFLKYADMLHTAIEKAEG
jgi:hypothetical protein